MTVVGVAYGRSASAEGNPECNNRIENTLVAIAIVSKLYTPNAIAVVIACERKANNNNTKRLEGSKAATKKPTSTTYILSRMARMTGQATVID